MDAEGGLLRPPFFSLHHSKTFIRSSCLLLAA